MPKPLEVAKKKGGGGKDRYLGVFGPKGTLYRLSLHRLRTSADGKALEGRKFKLSMEIVKDFISNAAETFDRDVMARFSDFGDKKSVLYQSILILQRICGEKPLVDMGNMTAADMQKILDRKPSRFLPTAESAMLVKECTDGHALLVHRLEEHRTVFADAAKPREERNEAHECCKLMLLLMDVVGIRVPDQWAKNRGFFSGFPKGLILRNTAKGYLYVSEVLDEKKLDGLVKYHLERYRSGENSSRFGQTGSKRRSESEAAKRQRAKKAAGKK